jgi:hypothetical protein
VDVDFAVHGHLGRGDANLLFSWHI